MVKSNVIPKECEYWNIKKCFQHQLCVSVSVKNRNLLNNDSVYKTYLALNC